MQLSGRDLDEPLRSQLAYDFAGDRLGVYLTNTLEEAEKRTEQILGPFRIISEEAAEAVRVKDSLPILVVMGNPPYSNFGRMNNGEWITGLMQEWKPAGEKKWNPDDFMKFMRWAQWRIEKTGSGIVAFITNNTYINGLTHRRMRESLLNTFSAVYVLDLHGGTRRRESEEGAGADRTNVFDIQQGVAISIFVKEPSRSSNCRVYHSELIGSREFKYAELQSSDVESTKWTELTDIGRESCLGRFYFFSPKGFEHIGEYCLGYGLKDIFSVWQNSLKTDRDALFFDFDRDALEDRMKTFFSASGLRREFRERWRIENSSSYNLLERRDRTHYEAGNIYPCLYRPFDQRWVYYDLSLTSRPAWKVVQHFVKGANLGLLSSRQVEGSFRHAFVTNGLANINAIDTAGVFGSGPLFPLYLYADSPGEKGGRQRTLPVVTRTRQIRTSNLKPAFVDGIASKLGLRFLAEGRGDLKTTFGPEDAFAYVYAILYSPAYRARYEEFLQIDFPRITVTSDLSLFRKLCQFGARLLVAHLLLEPPSADSPVISFPIGGDDRVANGFPKYVGPDAADLGLRETFRSDVCTSTRVNSSNPSRRRSGSFLSAVIVSPSATSRSVGEGSSLTPRRCSTNASRRRSWRPCALWRRSIRLSPTGPFPERLCTRARLLPTEPNTALRSRQRRRLRSSQARRRRTRRRLRRSRPRR